jgi:uncharacterized protein
MTFQILSLSGGGYRGLFTIEVLKRLEQRAGRPIGSCFDLIAGTSIGGIIAIGLALGKTAAEIHKMFIEHGERIFPEKPEVEFRLSHFFRIRRAMKSPRHTNQALKEVIEGVIGKETLLGEAKTRLLVPTVNMTKGSVQMFKTPHSPRLFTDQYKKAVDVAMATSAAPFIFPLAEIDNALYADGGLVANSPDACAIHEAVNYLGQRREDIVLISVGTTTSKFGVPSSYGTDYGAWRWVENQRILTTMFAAQQQLVDFMVKQDLADRYVRIDEMASPEQSVDLGLDKATPAQRKTLLGLAEAAFQRVSADPFVLKTLNHIPPQPEFVSTFKRPETTK